jgi:phospholipid/cholesterol/gamma-HCH transport system permease protein
MIQAPFIQTGAFLRAQATGAGHTLDLMGRTLLQLHALPRKWRTTLDQMYVCGVKTLPVAMFVAFFAGLILCLQTGIELRRFGSEDLVGRIVAASMCREMGPFMTAIILAATVGSSMAAEVGTMTVSEEITALEVMSIDPARYIVLPRVVALTIMCPILTCFTNMVGIVGGGVIADQMLGVSMSSYLSAVHESLLAPDQLFPRDIYVGLFKAVVFGFTIAGLGCSSGLRATEGAIGVGNAVLRAVRNSILMILVLGFLITWFFYSFLQP